MNAETINMLVSTGREIEFVYNKRKYSITYYNDNRKKYISFCEFYKEPIDVSNVDELLEIRIDCKTLKEIFVSLPDDCIHVF